MSHRLQSSARPSVCCLSVDRRFHLNVMDVFDQTRDQLTSNVCKT